MGWRNMRQTRIWNVKRDLVEMTFFAIEGSFINQQIEIK
jgi:hypothetical protein